MPNRPKSVDDLLFIGTYGFVRAIAKRSGRRVWQTSLAGSGYSIVNLLFEDGRLFAASKGRLYALDPLTGEVLWQNGLKGLGYGHVVLATTKSCTSPMPLVQALDDEAQSAGATTATT